MHMKGSGENSSTLNLGLGVISVAEMVEFLNSHDYSVPTPINIRKRASFSKR
jgi:precorrin-4 methylase